jgi:hypothetical protein
MPQAQAEGARASKKMEDGRCKTEEVRCKTEEVRCKTEEVRDGCQFWEDIFVKL